MLKFQLMVLQQHLVILEHGLEARKFDCTKSGGRLTTTATPVSRSEADLISWAKRKRSSVSFKIKVGATLKVGNAETPSHPARYDTDCFWLVLLPLREFLQYTPRRRSETKTGDSRRLASAMGGMSQPLFMRTLKTRPGNISSYQCLVCAPEKSQQTERIFPNVSILSHFWPLQL